MNHFLKIIIISVFLFSAVFTEQGNCMAQKNLVPNWSFEEFDACPNASNFSCFWPSTSIFSLKNWFCVHNDLTPNYFNSCSSVPTFSVPNNGWGFQNPKTGNAYMNGVMYTKSPGVNGWAVEYIECQLKNKLDTNKIYCVKYFTTRSSYSGCYCISGLGAMFSNSIISTYSPLNGMVPGAAQVKNPLTNIITDTKNWSVISGAFTANGNEQYLTIGNFNPLPNSDTLCDSTNFTRPYQLYQPTMYYFDDVSVEEVINANAGANQTIACGDSVRIGLDSAWAANYTWVPRTGLVNAQVPMPIAHPTITTTYTVTKQQCEVTTTSTVTVFVTNTCPYINYLDEFMIPNVFTPNGDNSNDVWQFTLGLGNNLKSLHIYDRWGLEIKSSQVQTQSFIKWDGYTTAGEPCTAGVYFYTLEYSNVLGEQNKLNGYITLIK